MLPAKAKQVFITILFKENGPASLLFFSILINHQFDLK